MPARSTPERKMVSGGFATTESGVATSSSDLPSAATPKKDRGDGLRPDLEQEDLARGQVAIRYHWAMSLTAPADIFSVFFNVRSGPTLAAIVISSPSRIQATPRAITSLVWNLDQGSRSIRAGIRLRMYGLLSVVEDVVAILRSLFSPA
jgi:hypothetical protein